MLTLAEAEVPCFTQMKIVDNNVLKMYELFDFFCSLIEQSL